MNNKANTVVLAAQGLSKRFDDGAVQVQVLQGVDIQVHAGETLAIVGESGCGKSTLARILTLIDPATSGDLFIQGKKVDIGKGDLTKDLRREVQIVFQNPYGSLNPRQKIGHQIAEPLLLNTTLSASERKAKVLASL